MSLKDDLARNRRIFEVLTGEDGGRDVSYRESAKDTVNSYVSPESVYEAARARSGLGPTGGEAADAVFQTARARGFSLENGDADLPAGFSVSPEIGGVTYPEIRRGTEYSPPDRIDPLELMYDRMETKARMSSQLSREEGSLGY